MAGTHLDFLLARVAQARAEGEAATLEHVRERCRRSEAAWIELAHRAERSAQTKATEALRKAEQNAAPKINDLTPIAVR